MERTIKVESAAESARAKSAFLQNEERGLAALAFLSRLRDKKQDITKNMNYPKTLNELKIPMNRHVRESQHLFLVVVLATSTA